MKVLILGGTGAMGVHLVKLLVEKGDETYVTSRQVKKSNQNLHYIQGNAKDKIFLRKCLKLCEWDAIIDFMVYDTQTFKQRFELLLNSTKQYVYLSSATIYANSDESITEESPKLLDVLNDIDYLKTDEYALLKARQENILKSSKKKNWTVIRPYITYSENRLQLGVLEKEEWLYRALRGRTIVFSKDILEKTTTLTYGLDVAKKIEAIIGNKSALGEFFHITATKSINWSEVLTIYLSALEKYLGFPPKVMLQNLDEFLESRGSKYPVLYDRLYNRKFDNSKINTFVPLDHCIEPSYGLKKCLENFLASPQFKEISGRNEANKDKFTKERTPLNEFTSIKHKIAYVLYRYFL